MASDADNGVKDIISTAVLSMLSNSELLPVEVLTNLREDVGMHLVRDGGLLLACFPLWVTCLPLSASLIHEWMKAFTAEMHTSRFASWPLRRRALFDLNVLTSSLLIVLLF